MQNDEMAVAKLVIITGMSGAGKTVAVQSMEDLGYFCVDNLPPILIPKFAELITESHGKITKVAIVVDLRSGREFFTALFDSVGLLSEYTISHEILFLDASDQVLVQRYKESRRRHPLDHHGQLLSGIQAERKMLANMKSIATYIVDTSEMKPVQLKERLKARFGSGTLAMSVTVTSFGFKHGIPIDADLLFDVRFLPNPHYIEELRPKTGQSPEVYDYVMKRQETRTFLAKLTDLLDFLIPQYQKEGKTHVVIGIGCTGGKHRSVAISEYLGKKIALHDGVAVNVTHRDAHKE
jgi:UPF0042 nucleotide-binding protein